MTTATFGEVAKLIGTNVERLKRKRQSLSNLRCHSISSDNDSSVTFANRNNIRNLSGRFLMEPVRHRTCIMEG